MINRYPLYSLDYSPWTSYSVLSIYISCITSILALSPSLGLDPDAADNSKKVYRIFSCVKLRIWQMSKTSALLWRYEEKRCALDMVVTKRRAIIGNAWLLFCRKGVWERKQLPKSFVDWLDNRTAPKISAQAFRRSYAVSL
jgi:hypothetical protein